MKILAEPIDMIAKTMKDGSLVPVKYRFFEGDEMIEVRVDRIVWSKESRYGGSKAVIFCCQSVIRGIEKKYELKYRIDKHIWELYKM